MATKKVVCVAVKLQKQGDNGKVKELTMDSDSNQVALVNDILGACWVSKTLTMPIAQGVIIEMVNRSIDSVVAVMSDDTEYTTTPVDLDTHAKLTYWRVESPDVKTGSIPEDF